MDADCLSQRPHDSDVDDKSALMLQKCASEKLSKAKLVFHNWEQLSEVTYVVKCHKQAIHIMVQTCGEDTSNDSLQSSL